MRELFFSSKYVMFYWSRLIFYPKKKYHLNIYNITYKGEKDIWDYEKKI